MHFAWFVSSLALCIPLGVNGYVVGRAPEISYQDVTNVTLDNSPLGIAQLNKSIDPLNGEQDISWTTRRWHFWGEVDRSISWLYESRSQSLELALHFMTSFIREAYFVNSPIPAGTVFKFRLWKVEINAIFRKRSFTGKEWMRDDASMVLDLLSDSIMVDPVPRRYIDMNKMQPLYLDLEQPGKMIMNEEASLYIGYRDKQIENTIYVDRGSEFIGVFGKDDGLDMQHATYAIDVCMGMVQRAPWIGLPIWDEQSCRSGDSLFTYRVNNKVQSPDQLKTRVALLFDLTKKLKEYVKAKKRNQWNTFEAVYGFKDDRISFTMGSIKEGNAALKGSLNATATIDGPWGQSSDTPEIQAAVGGTLNSTLSPSDIVDAGNHIEDLSDAPVITS